MIAFIIRSWSRREAQQRICTAAFNAAGEFAQPQVTGSWLPRVINCLLRAPELKVGAGLFVLTEIGWWWGNPLTSTSHDINDEPDCRTLPAAGPAQDLFPSPQQTWLTHQTKARYVSAATDVSFQQQQSLLGG